MIAYLERRSLPQPYGRWLVVLSGALLVVPVGTLLPGSGASAAEQAAAILAIIVVAPVLGMGLARPRRTVTVDADAGTISIRVSGELPDPRTHEEHWPIKQAQAVEVEDLGSPTHRSYGVRIDLIGDDPIHLNAYRDRDLAQDTVDHLVLLGLPGHSRASDREQSLAAGPPETWL